MRQWWRKIGRQGGDALDGVTGATRKPGDYRIAWDYSKLVAGDGELGKISVEVN